MKIINTFTSGTLESSDIMITLSPGDGISITVDSAVYSLYGKTIENIISQVISEFEISDVSVFAKDNGARDYVIRARVESAIKKSIKRGVANGGN